MTNIAPNSAERNPYPCRTCGKTIYWHKSKAGKNYPCDSANDRRAFHQCEPAQQPAKNPQPTTPDFFEATLEQRVAGLEKQLAAIVRTIQEIQSRQPMGDGDVPW